MYKDHKGALGRRPECFSSASVRSIALGPCNTLGPLQQQGSPCSSTSTSLGGQTCSVECITLWALACSRAGNQHQQQQPSSLICGAPQDGIWVELVRLPLNNWVLWRIIPRVDGKGGLPNESPI
ncbi:TPA: hypothetical protein ACH3X2_013408 [Trebouxia sp. C0005]